MKKALITGITGQDGSYLAEFLMEKSYEVHGTTRKNFSEKSKSDFQNLGRVLDKVFLHQGSFADERGVRELFLEVQPDEIYHLAGAKQSRVLNEDFGTFDINIGATRFWLAAIEELKKTCRFFFAGSSEMFGKADVSPQNENTPFKPLSPYAISKVAGYYLVKMYGETAGIFGCTGILYNHESPRGDTKFLCRKISSAAARIKLGLEKELRLGDLNAERDWGFAGDYVEAMWLMLQAGKSADYVVGTGINHSVKDVLEVAFGTLDLNWQDSVVVDEKFVRQEKGYTIMADISRIKNELGWQPRTTFEEMIKMMVKADLDILKNERKT